MAHTSPSYFESPAEALRADADIFAALVADSTKRNIPYETIADSEKSWEERVAAFGSTLLALPKLGTAILEDSVFATVYSKIPYTAPAAHRLTCTTSNLHVHAPNIVSANIGTAALTATPSVLLGGEPALRCGDVGFAFGACPPKGVVPFTVETGSSTVFIGGARASRILDFTSSCPLAPKDMRSRSTVSRRQLAEVAAKKRQSAAASLGTAMAYTTLSKVFAYPSVKNDYWALVELRRQLAHTKDPEAASILRSRIEAYEAKESKRRSGAVRSLTAMLPALLTASGLCGTSPAMSSARGILWNWKSASCLIGGFPKATLPIPWPRIEQVITTSIRHTSLARIAFRTQGWRPGRQQNFLPPSRAVCVGDPVDVGTGRVLLDFIVCTLNAPTPFTLKARYSSGWAGRDSALGFGWSHNLEVRAWIEPGQVVVFDEQGCEVEFELPQGNTDVGSLAVGTRLFQPFARRTLIRGRDNTWELCGPPGVRRFLAAHPQQPNQWLLTSVVAAGQTAYRCHRGPKGRLLAAVLPKNRRIAFHYDHHGHLKQITTPAPDGRSQQICIKFVYTNERLLAGAREPGGKIREFQYKGSLLAAHTLPTGVTYRYEYDGDHPTSKCTYTSGDEGRLERAIEYTKDGRKTFVTDGAGNIAAYHINELGAVTSIVDCQGGTTKITYNDTLWPTTYQDAHGNTHHYSYDDAGNLVAHTDPAGITTRYHRDQRGLIVARVCEGRRWAWQRNYAGQITRVTDPSGRETLLERNDDGRVIAVTFSPTKVFRFSHTPAGLLAAMRSPDGARHRWSYNYTGQLIRMEDPVGRATSYSRDARGRVLSVTLPDATRESFRWATSGLLTRYCGPATQLECLYNKSGQPVLVRLPTSHWRLAYDAEGRLQSWENSRGQRLCYTRDRLGAIVEEQLAGVSRAFRRNLLGQIYQVDYADGAVHLEYDPCGRVSDIRGDNRLHHRFRYNAHGQLVWASNHQTPVELVRDQLGRITEERVGEQWVRQQYDLVGELMLVQTSAGLTLRYGYNDRGRLVSTTFEQQGHPLGLWAFHDHYTACGRLRRRELVYEPPGPPRFLQFSHTPSGTLAQIDDVRSSNTQALPHIQQLWPTAGGFARVPHDETKSLSLRTADIEPTYEDCERDERGRVCTLDNRTAKTQLRYDALNRVVEVASPQQTYQLTYDALGRCFSTTGATQRLDWSWHGPHRLAQTHSQRSPSAGPNEPTNDLSVATTPTACGAQPREPATHCNSATKLATNTPATARVEFATNTPARKIPATVELPTNTRANLATNTPAATSTVELSTTPRASEPTSTLELPTTTRASAPTPTVELPTNTPASATAARVEMATNTPASATAARVEMATNSRASEPTSTVEPFEAPATDTSTPANSSLTWVFTPGANLPVACLERHPDAARVAILLAANVPRLPATGDTIVDWMQWYLAPSATEASLAVSDNPSQDHGHLRNALTGFVHTSTKVRTPVNRTPLIPSRSLPWSRPARLFQQPDVDEPTIFQPLATLDLPTDRPVTLPVRVPGEAPELPPQATALERRALAIALHDEAHWHVQGHLLGALRRIRFTDTLC